jgi:hypothetical protein
MWKVLGVKCKTPECDRIIPLPVARLTVFPNKDSTVEGTCHKCGKRHVYGNNDVVETGDEIHIKEITQ